MTKPLDAAALDEFWQALESGRHFPAEWHDRLSSEEAYRVQLAMVARQRRNGAAQAGWKVAQTSLAAQRAFGFSGPVFGCIMAANVWRSGHVYGQDALIRPRCEPEICVRLKSDLSGKVDAEMVRRAIDVIYPAFEIIEVRGDIATQKALAIADNAATKDIVLGEPATFHPGTDLASLRCRFWLNNDDTLHGTGADVLGNPVNAVSWLAEELTQFGLYLRSGDLIMTGSLTSPAPLSPGDHAYADFTGLGAITVSVTA